MGKECTCVRVGDGSASESKPEVRKMVTTIDPVTDKRWDEFIMNHPESTIFHHSAWTRVLMDRYRCSPTYYVVENERGEISAAAPFFRIKSALAGKRLVCLPGSEFSFPLAYGEEDLKSLLDKAKEDLDTNGLSYLEIRGWGKAGSPEDLGLKQHHPYLTHTVSLEGDLQKVRARMDRNGRYNLRYAEKSALAVRMGQSEDDLKEFHRLATATRRRLKLLPQPYQYFQSIYQHVLIPGHGYLLLAELRGKVIAANIYFCFKDTVTHEFAAADKDFLEYRPNYLLIWKAMERACQESQRYYNFGRTHFEDLSLANFKRHWGSEETTLPYYYYPKVRGTSAISQTSLIYRAHASLNNYLPGFLLKYLGHVMHRHMG